MGTAEDLKEFVGRPIVYRSFILAAVISVALLYFTSYVVTAALVVSVAVVAWAMNKVNMKRFGVELTTLSTVLIAVTYGPAVGAGMGLALVMLQVTAGQYTGSYIIWVIPSYAVAGLAAGVLSGLDIFTLGFGLTVVMQAVFATLTSVTSSGKLQAYLPYAVTNIAFNLLMFSYVAPVLLPLMS
ncbi:MAG: hypothetical protein ABEJ66_00950 [Candidatus Nanohaloarchaea archaeon]